MKTFNPQDAEEVGHALENFGINLLVSNVARTVSFLQSVLGFTALNVSSDYALLEYREVLYQLHADHTYANNPLPSLLPEAGVRGGGVELRLFEVNPDAAEEKARTGGYVVLMETADKPHGLRECFLLDPDGYCWVPSVKIARLNP